MGPRPASSPRAYVHTLGCPKNEADSRAVERMLKAAGVWTVSDPDDATHILINTCGFIHDAKEESINAVLDACRCYPDKRVVVFGCLVKRYEDELRSGIPEVAGWLGIVRPGFERELKQVVGEEAAEDCRGEWGPRSGERQSHAYIKVSDGCDQGCSFCAIPGIKGPYHSVPASVILEEAESCLERGARELILVGQDTSRWKDGGMTLTGLIEKLSQDDRVRWLRVLYLQPDGIDRGFLEFMASQDRICRYLDIPFQHSHVEILTRMGRHGEGQSFLALLAEARRLMLDVWTRSTFIVGFPGESDQHFEHLLHFVEKARFDYAGGFVYSPEEGTRAADLRPRVSVGTAQRRLSHLAETIASVSESEHRELIGTEVEVMIDEVSGGENTEGAAAVGHTRGQAPDVDGATYVEGNLREDLVPGDVVMVRISAVAGWDLIGDLCAP